MASSVETALRGLVGILTLAKRPEPNPGSLGDYRPTLTGLSRDDSGIVMQLENGGALDGGDSAHRTGVLAFCKSDVDSANLPLFIVQQQPAMMTRHPTQAPWDNPNNCTRDQLIGYIAGCWRSGRTDIVAALLQAHANRAVPYTCQDIENDAPGTTKSPPIGDPLGPHDIMYFRICAGDSRAGLDLAGQFALYMAIVLSPAAVDQEPTQILLQSMVCGQLDIYLATHQNYVAALDYYWGGIPWRGQQSIANSLADVVNIESGRYSSVSLLDFLLPQHLLDELRNLDIQAEMQAFMHGNPLVFAQLTARFMVAALRDIGDEIDRIVGTLETLDEIAREVALGIVAALRSYAAQAFGKISDLVANAQIDPAGFTGTILQIAATVLGLGSTGDDAAEAAFRVQVTQSLNVIVKNTEAALKAIGDLQADMKKSFSDLAATIKDEFYDSALGDLKADVANANILLDTVEAGVADDDLTLRLQISADAVRTRLIFMCENYGSGTLAYCFQAYGVLIALLNAAGKNQVEMNTTRDTLGREYFEDMLDAADGPVAQLAELQRVEATETQNFDTLQPEVLCGVISRQQSKLFYPPQDGGEPVAVPAQEWINTGLFCSVAGAVDQPALVTSMQEWRALPTTPTSVGTVAAVQVLAPAAVVSSDAQFMIARFGGADPVPVVGSQDRITAVAMNRGDGARQAAQKVVDSRRMQPDLEALVTGIRTAFLFE